ncbi:MAG: tetratricopeptide repeat protein [Acidobacteria bacterium]|nr:tetratricopeptide repeat protein [Acidobacteriota bacterium]
MRHPSVPRIALLLALTATSALAAETASPERGPVVDLATLAPGEIHSGLGAAPDPTQTFELYLPSSFDPAKRWPLLLVFDPRSRGKLAAEIFRPVAEELGWIVASSDNTMSDGPWEPNIRAVNAMFPDLVSRLPVDTGRIYATGFSGGAMLSWIVGVRTGQLAGVLSVGGRLPDGLEKRPIGFAFWATAGRSDFNYRPSAELDELAAELGVPHRLEYFDGPHTWLSPEEARRALRWFEVLAMRDGKRPRDDAFLDAELAADVAGADALERDGRTLEALRRLEAVVSTYGGLRDVSVVETRLRALDRSAAAKAARKEEKWAARYEEQGLRRLTETVWLLRQNEVPPPPSKLRSTLGLQGLLSQRDAGGERGEAASRVLASVSSQLGFYLMRDLFASGDFPKAVAALAIATEVTPDSPFAWYNLACAQARTGDHKHAIASLERALDAGLPRPDQMKSDSDLDSLRDEPAFQQLLARAIAP